MLRRTTLCAALLTGLAVTVPITLLNIADAQDGSRTYLPLILRLDPAPVPDSSGVTTRVSVASHGSEIDGSSGLWSISADGRFVGFSSSANDVVTGDTNGKGDGFVHDRATGTTTRVTVASDGTEGNAFSRGPLLSADGRIAAFTSQASNLVTDDTNGWQDAFVRDLETGQTTRVSVASDGSQLTTDPQEIGLDISDDGRFVVFETAASDLVANDTNEAVDLFLHDRQNGQTTRISLTADGSQLNGSSYAPSISADGRFVAFVSEATNVAPIDPIDNGVYVLDRQSGRTSLIAAHANEPSISADGRFIAFGSFANDLVADDTNGQLDVFVYDQQTTQISRVSVSSQGTQGNSVSYLPSISADGHVVGFVSQANTLVAGDAGDSQDTFVHDLQTGTTTRVSVATDGTPANDISFAPELSADGRFVAFVSLASNLVAGDTNSNYDVFVRDRMPTP